jgi:hypothetical protein
LILQNLLPQALEVQRKFKVQSLKFKVSSQ